MIYRSRERIFLRDLESRDSYGDNNRFPPTGRESALIEFEAALSSSSSSIRSEQRLRSRGDRGRRTTQAICIADAVGFRESPSTIDRGVSRVLRESATGTTHENGTWILRLRHVLANQHMRPSSFLGRFQRISTPSDRSKPFSRDPCLRGNSPRIRPIIGKNVSL